MPEERPRPVANNTRAEQHLRKAGAHRQAGTLIPLRASTKTEKFEKAKAPEPDLYRFPKYSCHIVMNHASPATLTQLARSPKLRIPASDSITTTDDITRRSCFDGKMARAPPKRALHTYLRVQSFSSDIMVPLHVPGLPADVSRYFISFVDMATPFAYVASITSRRQASQMKETFLNKVQEATGVTPQWLISENDGGYTSEVVRDMLGDMNVSHIPAIAYNSEENAISERFNSAIMNSVRVALKKAVICWNYWSWALADATDKYNQVTHRSKGKSPHELWFQS